MRRTRVVIIGCGVGGSAMAAALSRQGTDFLICERTAGPEPIGFGITVQINGMLALAELGVAERVAEAGYVLRSGALCRSTGHILARQSLATVADELGSPAVGIERARLQELLLEPVPVECVEYGRHFVGYEQRQNEVIARFADGTSYAADLLVAADGLRSTARAQLLADGHPRFAGYACWRGLGESIGAELPADAVEYWGKGDRVGLVRLAGGRVYWFAVANAKVGESDPNPSHTVGERFAEYVAPVPEIIRGTAAGNVALHDIFDRPPGERWVDHRVALLGDAAHPATPNLGQGGCMAMEDAVVLAQEIARNGATPKALTCYQARRVSRANAVVRDSYQLGRIAQIEGTVATQMRDLAIKMAPPSAVMSRVRRLMHFDPTA